MVNNFANLPDPQHPVSEYDFQVIVTPLRMLLPEADYFRASDENEAASRDRLAACVDKFRLFLETTNRFNRESGILTFITSFIVPQQDAPGRFYGRYDLRNIRYFIEELNREIHEIISKIPNCYVVSVEDIAASLGKQYFLDDNFGTFNHNGIIVAGAEFDYHLDQGRLAPPKPLSEHYELHGDKYYTALAREIGAMYRTAKQIDQVKLVIVDLDDTLWRGVTAEDGLAHHVPMEGWPLGLAEVLGVLRRRGIMLAIASKNSETRIAEVWDTMMWGRLSLSDFVAKKINWLPKADNISAILQEVNILPSGAVFIDDNPAERDAVAQAFPGIRVLGSELYYLRRTLLNAPETQTTHLTAESAARSEMVKMQIEREQARQALTREQFLATLGVEVRFSRVTSCSDKLFPRCFELINKTNQFNTTGKRWVHGEMVHALSSGGNLLAFEVRDRFTVYGIVGVIILAENTIEQFVMSCRVFGIGVETAALAHIAQSINGAELKGALFQTPANGPCQNVFRDNGFLECGESWSLPAGHRLTTPSHISILEG